MRMYPYQYFIPSYRMIRLVKITVHISNVQSVHSFGAGALGVAVGPMSLASVVEQEWETEHARSPGNCTERYACPMATGGYMVAVTGRAPTFLARARSHFWAGGATCGGIMQGRVFIACTSRLLSAEPSEQCSPCLLLRHFVAGVRVFFFVLCKESKFQHCRCHVQIRSAAFTEITCRM